MKDGGVEVVVLLGALASGLSERVSVEICFAGSGLSMRGVGCERETRGVASV